MAGPHPITLANTTFDQARKNFSDGLAKAGALAKEADEARSQANKAIAEAAKVAGAPPFPPAAPDSLEQARAAVAALQAFEKAKEARDKVDKEKKELDRQLKELENAKQVLDEEINKEGPKWMITKAWAAISNAVSQLAGGPPPLTQTCPNRGEDLAKAQKDILGVPKDAMDKADKALEEAKKAAEDAVNKRLDELRREGHGPQRHSDPDDSTLKKRVLYGFDPETGCQLENLPGGATKLHVAGATASKFVAPEDYVKAEAAMREMLKNQVCPPPPGVPAASADRVKLDPPLTSVFPDPNKHCKGFQAVNSPPIGMTSKGPVPAVPAKPGTAVHHPPAPAIPPLTIPPPPPNHSNALRDRYLTAAQDAVKQGADPQTAMNRLQALGGAKPQIAAAVADAVSAAPPPLNPATDPLAAADIDVEAVNKFANDPANTQAASFAAGKFTAIFDPVDKSQPCGEWTLLTMYPNP